MDFNIEKFLAWLSVVVIVIGFIKIIKDQATDKANTANDIKNIRADIINMSTDITNEVSNRQKELEEMCGLIDKVVQKLDVVVMRLADISIIDGNQKATDRRITQFEQMQEKFNDKFEKLTDTVNKIWVSLEGKANKENNGK